MVVVATTLAVAWYSRPRVHLPAVDLSQFSPRTAELIAHAQEAVQKAPRSGEAWGRLGSVLWAHELLAEAAACFEQAEKFAPREVRWPYLRGLCLERHQPDLSLTCIRRAVLLSGDLPLTNLQLAEMLLARGELKEAEEILRRTMLVAPGDSRVLLNLGRLALMKGDTNEALQCTSHAAEIDPSRRRIRLLLCQIHQRRGDTKAAEEQLRVINELPPVSPYYEWPDPFLAEASRAKVDESGVVERAQELMEGGRSQQAIQLLDSVGGRNSRNIDVTIMLARALRQTGELGQASELLLAARQRAPDHPLVHYELGNLSRITGRNREAVEHYREAVRLEPTYAIAYYYLSASLRELDDRDGAIEALQAACQHVPDNLRVQRELIEWLWRYGHREAAMEQLRGTLQRAPNDPECRQLLKRLRSLSETQDDALDPQGSLESP
jgi:tetratricopeptide (TPR) repeat protein